MADRRAVHMQVDRPKPTSRPAVSRYASRLVANPVEGRSNRGMSPASVDPGRRTEGPRRACSTRPKEGSKVPASSGASRRGRVVPRRPAARCKWPPAASCKVRPHMEHPSAPSSAPNASPRWLLEGVCTKEFLGAIADTPPFSFVPSQKKK